MKMNPIVRDVLNATLLVVFAGAAYQAGPAVFTAAIAALILTIANRPQQADI